MDVEQKRRYYLDVLRQIEARGSEDPGDRNLIAYLREKLAALPQASAKQLTIWDCMEQSRVS